ncbi:hypothetical protein FISHEDRAFT_78815 [Fistulina hepatica ATCC 64428]|uniref:Fungal-type protein kinase domain-containing protein n=1 Tax=Fistulina hepatica ATCC 64428 TaxID=1128425 RepID=A0A0D6ZZ98_9AGAR|nr:hypothetical protein FISHEDRAFT_78815 [Fistulina hepatica ATCC 64428]
MAEVQFFEDDERVPEKLKDRIRDWSIPERCPALQFQQYGPINSLLHYVFGEDYIVKPQALIRPQLEAGRDEEEDELQYAERSFDSMGAPVGITKEDTKCYPDFSVCEYSREHPDAVRLIIEVASVGHQRAGPSEDQQQHLIDQVEYYLRELGEHGDRWDTKVVGIGILGHHCLFITRTFSAAKNQVVQRKSKWYTIYDAKFERMIRSVMGLPYPIN